jgi:hypothetical protein
LSVCERDGSRPHPVRLNLYVRINQPFNSVFLSRQISISFSRSVVLLRPAEQSLLPAEQSFALRCGRPRYNCGRSSFLWVTCAVGPCRPALHSRGCTVRKLDAAIALRLVPRGRRPVAPCSCLHTHAGRGHGPASWSIGRAVTARARLAMHRCTVASAQHTKEDAGAVELAYNPYFSTYFFN